MNARPLRQTREGRSSIVDNGKHYVAHGVTLATPGDEAEVRDALLRARASNRPVIARGAGKSQGGLYQAENAVILDMSRFNKVLEIDAQNKRVRVQSGVIWDQLRQDLEPHGMAVASSQSYGVFSVGGSISINAHGRNIDVGVVAKSVLSIRVMLSDGAVVEASREADAELFSLVIGGLGLFGVVLEATLALLPNRLYRCNGVSVMQSTEYPGHVSRNVLSDSSIHFHYARFDIADDGLWDRLYAIAYFQDPALPEDAAPGLTAPPSSARLERAVMWVVRRAAWARRMRLLAEIIYRLDMKPRRRSGTVREAWSVVDHTRRRNADWLQEYFIPRDRFMDFVRMAKPVLSGGAIRVLNTTVRVIHQNRDAFLAYARQDCFSFVIFFEQKLDPASIQRTEDTLRQMIDCAIACGGAYYLCYQRVATPAQLARAYPAIGAFFAAKRRYDPEGLFVNEFYKQYAPAFPVAREAVVG